MTLKFARLALAAVWLVASPAPSNAQPITAPAEGLVPPAVPDTQLVLAAPFRGKTGTLGWRLAGMFVAGLDQRSDEFGYSVGFLDAELPLRTAWAYRSLAQLPGQSTVVVGPLQRARSEAWRPAMQDLGLAQLAFAARDGSALAPRFTLALDPAVNAAALADYLCRESRTRQWGLLVPQNTAGERFARSFAQASSQCPEAVLNAVTWYREDLEDLTVRAREHYGIDRIPFESLERQQRSIDTVEGILQSDVTLVIASPDALQRLINELLYQGSSFQVFVGDFNFGHAKVVSEVKWPVPPLFLDHYPRSSALVQSASFQHFTQSAQKFMKGSPTTADLLLYEAGQLATQGAFSTAPTDRQYEAAGGNIQGSPDGSFTLALYPLTISDGTVNPASTGQIDKLVARQKEQQQKFIQARDAARANKAKNATPTPP